MLPVGTITFLFTDIEGSTRRWDEDPDAMRVALARHDGVLRRAVVDNGGHVVKTTGDGVHAVFGVAEDAVRAAVAAQIAIDDSDWEAIGGLRIRAGVHTGSAELRDGDYYGTAVNRAARLMAAAHGGQIVVSNATQQLVRADPTLGCEFVDLGEHQLRDLGEPERIYQVAHPGIRREFPPLRSMSAYPSNLPLQATSFVGRDNDLEDVCAALRESRVVTLTGVGGVGKTRLAVHVAAQMLPIARDGAWICELGPLKDPDDLPDLVAGVLGIQPRRGFDMTQSIIDALRTRQMLLVLDNCEHVIAACAALVQALLSATSEIRVLATSREGLGLRGERIIAVRSLEVAGEHADLDALVATEAARLFADRARDVDSSFAIGADNALAVSQLCRRLDGIPLALELAAARTRMMTPIEIASRLDERFRLLTGGSRTAVERHQTLRQTVDWSYDLLDAREQAVLARLGVFVGGFTLDAAEAVVSGDGIDPLDVLDLIGQLVDKSLVVAEHDSSGSRYRLLETIRQYALERLEGSGQTDAVRRRHAAWCAEFLAATRVGLRGPDEAAWLDRLDHEIDNVRAGVTWAVERDDAELAMRQIGAISPFPVVFRVVGYRLAPLAVAALTTTHALEQPHAPRVLALRALDHLIHDRIAEVERDSLEGIRIGTRPGFDPPFDAWVAFIQAYLFSGRARQLEEYLPQYMAAARETGDPYILAMAASLQASWYFAIDVPTDDQATLAAQAVELADETRNPTAMVAARMALGGALMTTDPERARAVLIDAVEIGTSVHDMFFVGIALVRLARLGADPTDPTWAARFRGPLAGAVENFDHRITAIMVDLYIEILVTTRPEVAATLYGFVEANGLHVDNERSVSTHVRVLDALREQLGETQLAELRARGAALGHDEAGQIALAELDRVIAGARDR